MHAKFVMPLVAVIAALGCRRAQLGVVLPEAEARKLLRTCSREAPSELSGRWDPPRRELDELEERLGSLIPAALARARVSTERWTLTDFNLQYGGFYRAGAKVVYVNAVAHSWLTNGGWPDEWKHRAIIICDGGDSTFGIVYDVAARRFDSLAVNGILGSGPSVSLDGLQ